MMKLIKKVCSNLVIVVVVREEKSKEVVSVFCVANYIITIHFAILNFDSEPPR